jgi:hypothetical protein
MVSKHANTAMDTYTTIVELAEGGYSIGPMLNTVRARVEVGLNTFAIVLRVIGCNKRVSAWGV